MTTQLSTHMSSHASTHLNTSAQAKPARAVKRKTRITIYLDDEVLDEFRNLSERSGTGYQTLINAALRLRLAGTGAEPSLL